MVMIEEEGRKIIMREGEEEDRMMEENCLKKFKDEGLKMEKKFMDVEWVMRILIRRKMLEIVREKEEGFVIEEIKKGERKGKEIKKIGIEIEKMEDGLKKFLIRDEKKFGGR